MAQMKYKLNGEWHNLKIPLIVNNSGNSSAPSDLERVTIKAASTTGSAFPDLSPYVNDLAQIVYMSWIETSITTSGRTKYYYNYNYSYSAALEYIVKSTSPLHLVNGEASNSPPSVRQDAQSIKQSMYKLSGTPAAPCFVNDAGEQSAIPNFIGELIIYYKGE